jgi:hyperosmotically inducible protein
MKRIIAAMLLLGSASPALADNEDESPTVGEKVDQATDTTKREVTDSWITSKVKEEFMADSMVKGRKIHVSTRNHAVTLAGHVQSAEEQDRAVSLASSIDGVSDVINHLQVRPSGG